MKNDDGLRDDDECQQINAMFGTNFTQLDMEQAAAGHPERFYYDRNGEGQMLDDPAPDLRQLRLAYSGAIAASQKAERIYFAPPMPAYRKHLEFRHVMEARRLEEGAAGRAFLAALDEQDPACHVCGCTRWNPCIADESDVFNTACRWVHQLGEPPLCSACAGYGTGGSPC